jgi:DNA repair exonuclease SbcCD ATPase subunit
MTIISDSPKLDLAEVRRVADLLGFVVIPTDYLDRRSYTQENFEMQRKIEGFIEVTSKHFKPYVLCPIQYYSIENHVKSKNDDSIYAPTSSMQAFMAISFSVPLFRTMLNEMSEMKEKIKSIDKDLSKVERALADLATRVEQLAAQVEMQQKAIIEQRARQARLEKELAEARAFRAIDPMLIAIPRKKTIHDDTWALVGPCWGPDMPDIISIAYDLRKIKNQRDMLEKKTDAFKLISAMSESDRQKAARARSKAYFVL